MDNDQKIKNEIIWYMKITFALLITTSSLSIMILGACLSSGDLLIIKMIKVLLAVVLCMSCSLLPTFSDKKTIRFIWIGTLVVSVLYVMWCLDSIYRYENSKNISSSTQFLNIERQISETQGALNLIEARPQTIIERELISTSGWRYRQILVSELAEAKRAVILHEEIVSLLKSEAELEEKSNTNPTLSEIARICGLNPRDIQLAFEFFVSLLFELTGANTWILIFAHIKKEPLQLVLSEAYPQSSEVNDTELSDKLIIVRKAISSGTIKLTVEDVRVLLRCAQDKAQKVCKILKKEHIYKVN